MKFFIKYLSLCLGILISFNLYAWNALGHMLVADIAYQNLQPTIRLKVDKIVADLSKEYPYITEFSQIAPWPDSLRAQRIEIFTHWHYIDSALSKDGTPVKDLADTDNIVWAIDHIKPIVNNAKANPAERARFLAFLVHFVGDVHQPLHTVGLISSKHPDGDRGGNLYMIKYTQGKLTSMPLHKLWDGGFGEFTNDLSKTHVTTLSREISAQYPESFFGLKPSQSVTADWAKEGMVLAQDFVYSTPENESPSDTYLTKGQQISKQQIALAGYRLANLLNQLLADKGESETVEMTPAA
jgi:hypothetical protein